MALKDYTDIKFIGIKFSDICYLWKTQAIFDVYLNYLKWRVYNRKKISEYLKLQKEFKEISKNLNLSNDWFTGNIPHWMYIFDKYKFFDRDKKDGLKALEIGSFEGLSGYFFLNTFHNAKLTCVDTWEGSYEHKVDLELLKKQLENTFDQNILPFKDRVIKHKKTSFSYFNDFVGTEKSNEEKFDFIYVDGHHHADSVIVDAIKAFSMLKIGGIMIFDDYFWRFYDNPLDDPAAAVNAFLRIKKGRYKIIKLYYQIAIEKISD